MKLGGNLHSPFFDGVVENVDDPRGLGLTPLGYQFIAGILKHGPALCAAFAPTVNSYKRINAPRTTSAE